MAAQELTVQQTPKKKASVAKAEKPKQEKPASADLNERRQKKKELLLQMTEATPTIQEVPAENSAKKQKKKKSKPAKEVVPALNLPVQASSSGVELSQRDMDAGWEMA